MATMPPAPWVFQTLGKLMFFSGAFSLVSDVCSQGLETCTRRRKRDVDANTSVEKKDDPEVVVEAPIPSTAVERSCGAEFAEDYDGKRTMRYSLIHVFWNAPTHLPRLLIINALFPGPITVMVVVKKMVVNELIFSPIEAIGVMTFVQTFKDGGCANVPNKLKNDYPTFQLAKYAGHIPAHILMFALSTDIMTMMMINYSAKFVTEMFLSHVANRPIKKPISELNETAQEKEMAAEPKTA